MTAKDIISLRGDRDEWLDFVAKIKKQKKEVWDVIGPFIRKYATKK